jgi:hypothetical protein
MKDTKSWTFQPDANRMKPVPTINPNTTYSLVKTNSP